MDAWKEWIIPLGMSSCIPLTIVLLALYRLRIERKYGVPSTPHQVVELQSLLSATVPIFNDTGYLFLGHFNGRQLFRTKCNALNGAWHIQVECENKELIAFEAIFQSPHSAFLYKKIKGSRKTPRVLGDANAGNAIS